MSLRRERLGYAPAVAFRDDRDALNDRIASLERELEKAKRSASELEDAATEAGTLRARVSALEIERNQLLLGVAPVLSRMRVRFAVFVLALVLGIGVFLVAREGQVEGARVADEQHMAERDRQYALATSELEQARQEAGELRAQLAAAPVVDAPLAPPAPVEPPPEGVSTTGTVQAVTGHHGVRVGSGCSIDVTYLPPTRDCHAWIRCGATLLYAPEHEGFFSCETENGRIVRGRDDNPTDPSGDPQLDLDVDLGRVVVTDRHPDWSVTIVFDGANPF